MKKELVSIVIPVFNQAEFIVDTVESAVGQSYENIQVIVIDDGSTDDSAARVKAKFGDEIVLISQSNNGPSAAINAGMRAAEGEYIAFLGGDDIATPDRVQHQVEILEETRHDIIFSKPHLIDSFGERLRDEDFPIFYDPGQKEHSIFQRLLLQGNFICASSAMMRGAIVPRMGYFHPGLIQLQDFEYWLRACARGYSLAVFDYRIVEYRRHFSNLSSGRRDFAMLAELPLVIRKTLDGADPAVLRKEFPQVFRPALDSGSPVSQFEKSALLLSHPKEEVRAAGLSLAMQLYEDDIFMAEAASRGLNLFRMLYNAGETRLD
uniref:glycosyltransferase family 2 protein n=1 Tax=Bordetella sputigena TaxID=1416810 RepID=UPI0039F0601B